MFYHTCLLLAFQVGGVFTKTLLLLFIGIPFFAVGLQTMLVNLMIFRKGEKATATVVDLKIKRERIDEIGDASRNVYTTYVQFKTKEHVVVVNELYREQNECPELGQTMEVVYRKKKDLYTVLEDTLKNRYYEGLIPSLIGLVFLCIAISVAFSGEITLIDEINYYRNGEF